MKRKEVQKITGLSRKAIEYYQEKGFISPTYDENSYRNYSKEEIEILKKIGIFRKFGFSLEQIRNYLNKDERSLGFLLRDKKIKLDLEKEKLDLLENLSSNFDYEIINKKLDKIIGEESIYDRLSLIFPGYIGQCFFISYKPFLNEKLDDENRIYFDKFVEFLDNLPKISLRDKEKEYLEKVSADFSVENLEKINYRKIEAIENPEEFFSKNKEIIESYENYKKSDDYQNSIMKTVSDKIKIYMKENSYYEKAIPLLRKFSKSYDLYYKKLLEADEVYKKNIIDKK